MYARRFQMFMDKAPGLYGKIQVATVDVDSPVLPMNGTVDMALVIRGMHGWHRRKVAAAWLAQIHQALNPNGVLGIVQHRAKPDANPDESAERGYLPEKWVIEQVEAAGFKLSKKSEINKNEQDTTDHPEGVWTLPPTLRLGDTDKDKYLAIGESDRMTLRFVKVPKAN
jgi:predicted methyltransferase